jgi:hypothetical protein
VQCNEAGFRYASLLEAYLRASPVHREDLCRQRSVLNRLSTLVRHVRVRKGYNAKQAYLKEGLRHFSLSDPCSLPLNPVRRICALEYVSE